MSIASLNIAYGSELSCLFYHQNNFLEFKNYPAMRTPIIEVKVNGKIYKCLIDTGAARSQINSVRILKDNNLLDTNSKVYPNSVIIKTFSFSEYILTNVKFEVIYYHDIDSTFTLDNPGWDMVMGLDILKDFTLIFNLIDHSCVFLKSPLSISNLLNMTYSSDVEKRVSLDGSIGDYSGKWLIDTGNSSFYSLMDSEILKVNPEINVIEFSGELDDIYSSYNYKVDPPRTALVRNCNIGEDKVNATRFRIQPIILIGKNENIWMSNYIGTIPFPFFENSFVAMDFISGKIKISREGGINNNLYSETLFLGLVLEYPVTRDQKFVVKGIAKNSFLEEAGLKVGDSIFDYGEIAILSEKVNNRIQNGINFLVDPIEFSFAISRGGKLMNIHGIYSPPL